MNQSNTILAEKKTETKYPLRFENEEELIDYMAHHPSIIPERQWFWSPVGNPFQKVETL